MESTLADGRPRQTWFDAKGLWPFFAILALLALLEIALGFVALPLKVAEWSSLGLTLVTVGVPIYALFIASKAQWNWKMAAALLAGGLVIHLGLDTIAGRIHSGSDFVMIGAGLMGTVSQIGLLTWCLALGALIATLLKDRNMILPVAIFLAAFDVFLVLTPVGVTHILIQSHPEIVQKVAYKVPMMHTARHLGPIVPFARIGPADFLFLGMFFVDLNKYGMRAARTFLWVTPTLIGYLFIVALYGYVHVGPISLGALPALLPIGLVVVLVNRKEWKLSPSEKKSTLVVILLALSILGFGFWRLSQGSPAGPSPTDSGPTHSGSAPKPAPAQPG